MFLGGLPATQEPYAARTAVLADILGPNGFSCGAVLSNSALGGHRVAAGVCAVWLPGAGLGSAGLFLGNLELW